MRLTWKKVKENRSKVEVTYHRVNSHINSWFNADTHHTCGEAQSWNLPQNNYYSSVNKQPWINKLQKNNRKT